MSFQSRLVESLNCTAAELSDKCDVHPSTVHYWLKEGREPRGRTLLKLANALGVTEHYLLHGGSRKTSATTGPQIIELPEFHANLKRRESGKYNYVPDYMINGPSALFFTVIQDGVLYVCDSSAKPSYDRNEFVYYRELDRGVHRLRRLGRKYCAAEIMGHAVSSIRLLK